VPYEMIICDLCVARVGWSIETGELCISIRGNGFPHL